VKILDLPPLALVLLTDFRAPFGADFIVTFSVELRLAIPAHPRINTFPKP
jgi:hypothetical protein